MHRWGQAQMFRSLAFYLSEASKHSSQKSEVRGQMSEREVANQNGYRRMKELGSLIMLPIIAPTSRHFSTRCA
jgi:hypothetical protein